MGKKVKVSKKALKENIKVLGKDISFVMKAMNERCESIERKINSLNEHLDDICERLDANEIHMDAVSEAVADLIKDKNKNEESPITEHFEGHIGNCSFKVPEITIEGKKFNIGLDFDDDPFAADESENDNVNHPFHYTDGKYEVIQFIEDYHLPYHIGNAVKYISRAGKKDEDKYIEDLKKAEWYIFRWHNYMLTEHGREVFSDYRPAKDRINIEDYCKDKGLGFDLTKVINYIMLGEYYTAYQELHKYIGYLEELGHEPN